MRLAFADALHLRRMQGVDLAPALALPLLKHAPGQIERSLEDGLEVVLAGDLARDIADGTAQIGPERAQRPVDSLELFGVGVALVFDQRPLADPHIGPAQVQPDSWPGQQAVRGPG